MKDTMDTHLKSITDSMDTRLKTFTETMDAHLKTITNAMNTHLKIITAVLIVVVIFFLLATFIVYLMYQRPSPAPDKIYNHQNSENTPSPTLTGMFQNMATGKGLKVATEGEIATTYVKIDGEDCWLHEQCVTCIIMSESTGTITNCSAQRTMKHQYEISYEATSRGRHQLHIKVEGEHIKGSPFTVIVLKTLGASNIPSYTIEDLQTPKGITIDQSGHLIVVEYTAHRISILQKWERKF